jgi:nucleotide-binding universal stress UspA family protein
MNQSTDRRPYNIVVGIDYSEMSKLVLEEAVRVADAHEFSHIHVLYAVPDTNVGAGLLSSADPTLTTGVTPTVTSAPLSAEMSVDVQKYVEKVLTGLTRQAGTADSTDGMRWTTHLRHSEPAHALAQLAADVEADLILVGTHGRRGLARFLLGSVAESVVRLAPCPVLVVRPRGAQSAVEDVKIEPPCPDCLEARRASQGEVFWCERHRTHHERAHTYHFRPFRDSRQSGLLIHPMD